MIPYSFSQGWHGYIFPAGEGFTFYLNSLICFKYQPRWPRLSTLSHKEPDSPYLSSFNTGTTVINGNRGRNHPTLPVAVAGGLGRFIYRPAPKINGSEHSINAKTSPSPGSLSLFIVVKGFGV